MAGLAGGAAPAEGAAHPAKVQPAQSAAGAASGSATVVTARRAGVAGAFGAGAQEVGVQGRRAGFAAQAMAAVATGRAVGEIAQELPPATCRTPLATGASRTPRSQGHGRHGHHRGIGLGGGSVLRPQRPRKGQNRHQKSDPGPRHSRTPSDPSCLKDALPAPKPVRPAYSAISTFGIFPFGEQAISTGERGGEPPLAWKRKAVHSMLKGSTSSENSTPPGGFRVGSTARRTWCKVPGLGDWS